MSDWVILSYEATGKPGEDGFQEQGFAVTASGAVAVEWQWHCRAEPIDDAGRRSLGVSSWGQLRVSSMVAHDALRLMPRSSPPTRAELYRRLCLMMGDDPLAFTTGDSTIPPLLHGTTRWYGWVYAPNAEAAAAWLKESA